MGRAAPDPAGRGPVGRSGPVCLSPSSARGRVRRVRGHRQQRGQPLLAQLDQPVVALLAHQLDQLRAVGHVHRITGPVRRGGRGAPPVQVVTARTPAPAVVLTDRHLEHPGVVGPVDPVVRPPHRQLPAHVRLGLQRLLALPQRQDVQRAARPGGEAGPVLEDAGALPAARLAFAVLVDADPARPGADVVELPQLGSEPGHMPRDPLLVVLVGEVRAQRAAAVVRPARLDALAAAAEDARPPGGQPRQIAAEDLFVVGRVGELHPGPGEVDALLVGRVRSARLRPRCPRVRLLLLRGFVLLSLFRLWHADSVSPLAQ